MSLIYTASSFNKDVPICSHCNQDLPSSEFWHYTIKKSGKIRRENHCKNCSRIEYRAKYGSKATESFLDKRRVRWKKYRLKVKLEVLSYYSHGSMKCACCREDIVAFLTIDHIDGNGRKQREELGKNFNGLAFYQWLNKYHPEGYRVLCYNCNCGRRINGGICPHTSQPLSPLP